MCGIKLYCVLLCLQVSIQALARKSIELKASSPPSNPWWEPMSIELMSMFNVVFRSLGKCQSTPSIKKTTIITLRHTDIKMMA